LPKYIEIAKNPHAFYTKKLIRQIQQVSKCTPLKRLLTTSTLCVIIFEVKITIDKIRNKL